MEELFLISCSEGSLTTCKKIVRKTINVNLADFNGQTGLMKVSCFCFIRSYKIYLLFVSTGLSKQSL
jgi:hypothetical protein